MSHGQQDKPSPPDWHGQAISGSVVREIDAHGHRTSDDALARDRTWSEVDGTALTASAARSRPPSGRPSAARRRAREGFRQPSPPPRGSMPRRDNGLSERVETRDQSARVDVPQGPWPVPDTHGHRRRDDMQVRRPNRPTVRDHRQHHRKKRFLGSLSARRTYSVFLTFFFFTFRRRRTPARRPSGLQTPTIAKWPTPSKSSVRPPDITTMWVLLCRLGRHLGILGYFIGLHFFVLSKTL